MEDWKQKEATSPVPSSVGWVLPHQISDHKKQRINRDSRIRSAMCIIAKSLMDVKTQVACVSRGQREFSSSTLALKFLGHMKTLLKSWKKTVAVTKLARVRKSWVMSFKT